MARICPQYHAQQCKEQDRRFWLVGRTACSHSPVSVEVVGSSRAWISATYEMIPSLIQRTNLSGDPTVSLHVDNDSYILQCAPV